MDTATVDAKEWVTRANARHIGLAEFRQVAMRIGDGAFSRTLELRTLRLLQDDVARSVFCIIEPAPLANISYCVREQRGRLDPFEIDLYLPYVRGTRRRLAPSRRRETFLGGDFAYDDMRVWLYEEGHEYELLASGDSIVLRGRCTNGAERVRSAGNAFLVYLDPADHFIRQIDYLDPDGKHAVRRFAVQSSLVIEGIRLPARMTMEDLARGHRTSIELQRAWYRTGFDEAFLDEPRRLRDRLLAL